MYNPALFPLECLVARIANINATKMNIFNMERVFTQIDALDGAVVTWEAQFYFLAWFVFRVEGDWGSHSETVFLTRFFV